MKLRVLFMDEPVDFESRCRKRVLAGKCFLILGFLAVAAAWLYGSAGLADPFVQDFYTWTGIGFAAGGAMTVFRNRKYLRDQTAGRKRKLEECDERNRLLGLRSWAYSGYVLFLVLYLGFLASGFFDRTVMRVLAVVIAVQAALLAGFRVLLNKEM